MVQRKLKSVVRTPTQERSRRTVEDILTATAHILTREGYDHLTTNRIAEKAGVSIGSVYQFFGDKEGILATLIERHLSQDFEQISARIEGLHEFPPERAIQELVQLMFIQQEMNPKLKKAFLEQIPRVGKLQRVLETRRRLEEIVHEYLDRRVRDYGDQFRP
jgi:AcrR family transcriptional regulator